MRAFNLIVENYNGKQLWAMGISVLSATSPAYAQNVEFGEFTTINGSRFTVEEDFMDARYPRHVIVLASTNEGGRDGGLIFRCQQNRTEVFFVSGPSDFFGRSTSPVVFVRFPSDDQANEMNVSLSSDGEAVFFSNPVDFITKTLVDGSVGLMGSYYSGSFRHNYVLDEETKAAIYDLGTTCEWVDGLPAQDVVADEATPFDDLVAELEPLIAEYGVDLFREVSGALLEETAN